MRPHRVRDLLRELRPLLEGVSVARDEFAAMAANVRQSAEASSFGSKMKSGESNGSGMRSSRIGVTETMKDLAILPNRRI